MIRFFPMPYPDESLYSIFSRYNKLTGNNSYNITASELTGSKTQNITLNFANNLKFLCSQLPEDTLFNPAYFIENHTILPIFKSFVQEDRFENTIYNIMNLDKNITNPLRSLGYISLLNNYNSIVYCPDCINEDKKIYGEAYIHRSHQVDGNFICVKHKSFLISYSISNSRSYFFYDIDKLNIKDYYKVTTNYFYKELLTLSYSIDKIFENYSKLPKCGYVREKYFSILNEKGYLIKNGIINQIKLHDDFISYYTKNYLIFLNSYPEISKFSWLKKLLVNFRTLPSYHPIKHLLFINFLFGDIVNFLNYQVKSPLNYYNCQSGKCNFIADKSKKSYNETKGFHQNKIIKLLEQEPNLLRKQIYKRMPSSYQWIIRNEKDWLETNLPNPYRRCTNRIDWDKQDSEIHIKTLGVIKDILENNIPEKISAYALSKHIKYNFTKENLKKMPKTKALIEKYSESYPDFNKRKFEAYIHKMIT